MTRPRQVLLALVVGLALGAFVAANPDPRLLALVDVIGPVGTLWINALRMVVVPLVISLLVVGVASVTDVRAVGRVGGRAIAVFLLLLGVSALIGLTVVPALYAWLTIDPGTSAALRASAASLAESTTEGLGRMPTMTQWLVDLIPTNPVRAAADGAMLPLVIFSIAFGIAATRIPTAEREALVSFFRAMSEAMLVVVRWVLAVAPIGVFALSLAVAARMGISAAGAVGYYLIATAASMVILVVALYLVALAFARMSLPRFAKAALPAQAVGFASRSSLASLPAQVHGATAQLGLPASVGGFVLPLSVAVFKPHAPVNWAGLALFTSVLYGVPLGPADLLTIVFGALLLSFAVPGIPSAGMLLIAPLFVGAGLPVEAIGLLIAVDAIPDMFKTVANVTGQFLSGVLVGQYGRTDEMGARIRDVAAEPGAVAV